MRDFVKVTITFLCFGVMKASGGLSKSCYGTSTHGHRAVARKFLWGGGAKPVVCRQNGCGNRYGRGS